MFISLRNTTSRITKRINIKSYASTKSRNPQEPSHHLLFKFIELERNLRTTEKYLRLLNSFISKTYTKHDEIPFSISNMKTRVESIYANQGKIYKIAESESVSNYELSKMLSKYDKISNYELDHMKTLARYE